MIKNIAIFLFLLLTWGYVFVQGWRVGEEAGRLEVNQPTIIFREYCPDHVYRGPSSRPEPVEAGASL